MSNTRAARVGKPVIPSGDFGLGLCLQCLGEVIARGDEAPSPEFAITLAPMPFPMGNPVAFVPAPACWRHLQGAGQAAQRKPLLVANGGMR